MGDLINDELLRCEEIIEDNSDGVFTNFKKFLGFSKGSKKVQTKRDEIGYSNEPSNTSGEGFYRAKQLETNDKSETSITYHAGFVISYNEKNELVFTEDEKKNLQTLETDLCYSMPEEDEEDDDDNEYKLNHEKRGYMIQVINDYHNRSGAAEDLRKMNEIRNRLGFECFNSNKMVNLSKKDMQSVLTQAQQIDHTNCDCFLFVISCHGAESPHGRTDGEEDYGLLFADEGIMYVREIMRMFDDYSCPTLKGKPKLFFIQSCRGRMTDDGNAIHVSDCNNTKEKYIRNCHTDHSQSPEWDKSDSNREKNSDSGTYGQLDHAIFGSYENMSVLNCENDMLVMFAAPRGMIAWRNETIGSWMIHHLHEAFMDYNFAEPKSLLRVLTKVSRQMSRLQTHIRDPSLDKKTIVPVIENKLTKDILF